MWEANAVDPITKWIGNSKDIFEIAAIIFGGAWTYINYFRGRIYKPRLEPSITGKIIGSGGLLRVDVQIKNVGLSKVNIDQRGTALLIQSKDSASPISDGPRLAIWTNPIAFDVFMQHEWIESGEVICESFVLDLPENLPRSYKVRLEVVSGRITWNAESIAGLEIS